jgi:ribosome-binding protein aMBF1 (putative translation factor)
MSAHTKTRRTENKPCEVIIRMPGEKEIHSYIPKMACKKLEVFLSKYSEESLGEETIDWREVAKDSFEKYGEAGTYIRGARYREGLSQKTLAALSGVSQENISRIENGKRAVGEQVAKKLAKSLNIDYKMLL